MCCIQCSLHNSWSNLCNKNIGSSSDSTCVCLLESFYSHGGGWLIKSVCFWWSELWMLWVSEQAWVKLPIYWGRENTCSAALAHRVSPLQHPIQLPLMRAALSPPSPPSNHISCIRDLPAVKLQKQKQTNIGEVRLCKLFFKSCLTCHLPPLCSEWYRSSESFLFCFLNSACGTCCLQSWTWGALSGLGYTGSEGKSSEWMAGGEKENGTSMMILPSPGGE